MKDEQTPTINTGPSTALRHRIEEGEDLPPQSDGEDAHLPGIPKNHTK